MKTPLLEAEAVCELHKLVQALFLKPCGSDALDNISFARSDIQYLVLTDNAPQPQNSTLQVTSRDCMLQKEHSECRGCLLLALM